MEEVMEKLEAFMNSLEAYDNEGLNNFVEGLNGLFEALKVVGTVVGEMAKLGSAFNELNAGLSGIFGENGIFSLIQNGITGLFAGVSGGTIAIAATILAAVAAITIGLGYIFATNEKVRDSFSAAAETIKEKLQSAYELITETIIPGLQEGWERFLKIMEPFGEYLEHTFTSVWQDMINPALEYLGETVIPEVTEALGNLWNNVLVPFGEFLADVFTPVVEIVSEILFVLWDNVVVPLAAFIGGAFAKGFEIMVPLFNEWTERVKTVIRLFQQLWNDVLAPLIKNFWDILLPAIKKVFAFIELKVNLLKKGFEAFSRFFKEEVIDKIANLLDFLKDIVRTVLNKKIEMVEKAVNAIIAGINQFTSFFRETIGSIGEIIGIEISIPEIPEIRLKRFESGGYPNTGELFFARENGIPELVGSIGSRTAVASNDQIVSGIQSGVENALGNALSPYLELIAQNTQATARNTSGGLNAAVHIDGRELVSAYDARKVRNGYSFT